MLAEEHNQPSHKCITVDVSTAVSRRERKPLLLGALRNTIRCSPQLSAL